MWWLISCNQWMTVEQLQIHFSGLYGIQLAQDHQELKSWQIAFVNKNHMNILICNDCCHPCWYDSWVVKQHQIIVFLFCWILFSEQLHIVCVHGKQWHFEINHGTYLDDVWDENEIKPYDQLGLLCLVTSRKSHLLNGIRDRCLKVSIELIWMQCNEYIQYVYIIMKSALFIYSLRFPCQLVLLKIIPNSFGVNNLVICNHSV